MHDGWASYVGWYLGELYYTALGYTFSRSDETLQENQSWEYLDTDPTSNRIYSPLFVDMMDDYNQRIDGSWIRDEYVNDILSNVPHSTIRSIVANSSNWVSCRLQIKSHLREMYSIPTLINYLNFYDAALNHVDIRLWPNPARVQLNFMPENFSGWLDMFIYNSSGTNVARWTLSYVDERYDSAVNVSSLPSGNYTLVAKYPGGEIRKSFTKI